MDLHENNWIFVMKTEQNPRCSLKCVSKTLFGLVDDLASLKIGRMILNFCTIIGEGVVIFVPSFSYLSTLQQHLEKSGMDSRIKLKKAVFVEPRGVAEGEKVFKHYKAACTSKVHLLSLSPI